MKNRLFLAAMLAAVFGTAASAQECPHNTVTEVPTRSALLSAEPCSAGIDVDFGAVRITVAQRVCPTIRVEPAHNMPKHEDGCGTLAEFANIVPVEIHAWDCYDPFDAWFWLTAACQRQPLTTVGGLDNYRTVNCSTKSEGRDGN
ncbi:MAG: hypothetical protein IPK26_27970 [Planctomycetes bacterium]|nr:hypothetical protein [Planctomycetota bacterium]